MVVRWRTPKQEHLSIIVLHYFSSRYFQSNICLFVVRLKPFVIYFSCVLQIYLNCGMQIYVLNKYSYIASVKVSSLSTESRKRTRELQLHSRLPYIDHRVFGSHLKWLLRYVHCRVQTSLSQYLHTKSIELRIMLIEAV